MKEDKRPFNNKNQQHGYWEIYFPSNINICFKGNFINGKAYGIWEIYYNHGELDTKKYYIL